MKNRSPLRGEVPNSTTALVTSSRSFVSRYLHHTSLALGVGGR
jgi:hypothetical protein